LPYLVIDALARASGERYSTFDVVGVGPRVVAGVLEEFEETLLLPYERVISNIEIVRNFDAIFISAMSSDYRAVRKIVNIIQNWFRGPIVIGGPLSFEYKRVLVELKVDYVIVGEAEIPLRLLIQCLKRGGGECLESVPALAFKRDNRVVITSKHVYTPKNVLSAIKPWTKVDQSYRPTWIYRFYVEVLRGCSNFCRPLIRVSEFNCALCMKCRSPVYAERIYCPSGITPGCGFCSVPLMSGYPRSRRVGSVVSEIEELIKHGARRIVLSAPDFLDYGRDELVEDILTDPCNPPANLDAVESLLNSVYSIEEVKSGRVVVMIENIKACLVSEEVAKTLGKYLRGTTVHIGLETGCDWFNDRVLGKPISVKQVIDACKLLKSAGLRPYVYLMYDLPLATRDVYLKTLESVKALSQIGVEKITLYKYVKLPATAFEKLRVENSSSLRDVVAELKKLVNKYNTAMKRDLIGKRIEVYVVKTERGLYGYPVKHGPVVVISSRTAPRLDLSGCRCIVEIVDISKRAVRGRLISVLECPQELGVSQREAEPC